jgi:hypothetical protein
LSGALGKNVTQIIPDATVTGVRAVPAKGRAL